MGMSVCSGYVGISMSVFEGICVSVWAVCVHTYISKHRMNISLIRDTHTHKTYITYKSTTSHPYANQNGGCALVLRVAVIYRRFWLVSHLV